MSMKPFAFAFLSLILAGCSSLKSSPNRFVVEKRWVRHTLNQEYLQGRRVHRSAPIITDKLVIGANAIDGVVAYDRATTNVRWRLDIKDGVEGGMQLAEDALYFGAGDGQLYAVQPENGKVLWTYPLKAEGIAEPLVANGVLYVLGGNNVAHALNAKTGKLLWIYNRREASNISVRGGSQPALAGDLILIGFSDGALVALNKSSGSIVWEQVLNRNKRFRDVDATPVVDGDTVFASSYDGSLYALGRSDGKILWSIDEGGYDEVLVNGTTIYFTSTTGKTMALDKASGKVLWSKENPAGIAIGPVLFRNVLMVGEMEGALRFLDVRNGDLLGEFAPGRGVTSRPAIDPKKGEVYFMSHDANLYALRVNWKKYVRDWPWE
jgi:outer membrane protein assembly factor BamB